MSGGVEREIVLRAQPMNTPQPLVLIFHGGGGSAQFMARRSSSFAGLLLRQGYAVAFMNGSSRRDGQNLRTWNEKRAELTRLYRDALDRECPDVMVPFSNARVSSAYHIVPAILPEGVDRDRVVGKLRDAGIQTTIHYPPIHMLSLYRSSRTHDTLPQTERFSTRELTLPLHPKMSETDVDYVARTLALGISSG